MRKRKLNNYLADAVYMDGNGFRQYFSCKIIAESADEAFQFLDDRAEDLGLVCLSKSVQRED